MRIDVSPPRGAAIGSMRAVPSEETPRTRRRLDLALRRGPPAVTIVVIAAWETDGPVASLTALGRRCMEDGTELVVVCAGPWAETAGADRLIPGRRIVAPRGSTAADLRVLGMSWANGDIVAIVDDPADVDAAWLERVRSRGQVDSAPRRADEQAAGAGN